MMHRQAARCQNLRDLLRHEDREFPREFLATGAGRDVRSAFRALGRAIRTLDEYVHLDNRSLAGADAIVGEQLSEASFVRNYLQLVFDRSRFRPLSDKDPNAGLRGTVW
jgi:hypothetical protein